LENDKTNQEVIGGSGILGWRYFQFLYQAGNGGKSEITFALCKLSVLIVLT
jgi:hypothetical protein